MISQWYVENALIFERYSGVLFVEQVSKPLSKYRMAQIFDGGKY